jgi:hypothetical protein
MTTTFRTAERADRGDGRDNRERSGGLPPSPAAEQADGGRHRAGWLATHPAWPVTALLAGYPLWWALGLGDYVWFLLAVPMLLRMVAWRIHGHRPLRVPPGFAVWLLFLIWAIVAVCTLTLNAPGTVSSPVSHRVVAWAVHTVSYIGITVLFLYVGNLTERELPRRKLVWLLGLIAIYTTILGLAAIAAPHLQFTSPTALILPHSLQSNTFIQATTRPGLAQVQNVFGTSSAQGRPKAPFDYTNTWGECLTITVPWLLVVCLASGARWRRRLLGWAILVFALLGLLYSLNRGAWIATGFAVIYLAVRLAARGRTAVMGGLVALLGIAVIVGVATPVHTIISLRLQNGKSNDIRTSLFALSMQDGLASPILGYGDTRQQRGSPESIAIGPSAACETCGGNEVGSTGQLSLLIVSTGFVGAFLYYGFFAYGAWRYRRDRTAYGQVGVLVILLSFIYMFTYDAVAAPLGLTMLAYALLWRNDRCRQLTGHSAGPTVSRGPARGALRANAGNR